MANRITASRFLLLILLVLMAYWAPPQWQVANAPLLLLLIGLDGLDGYVARRRNEVTPFGAIFDIAADRTVENVLWVVLGHIGLVPIWVALVFITRGCIVDSIRYAAISKGQTAFGMMRTRWGQFFVASRFMRGFYGAVKAATFAWVLFWQPMPVLMPEWVVQPDYQMVGMITNLLIFLSVSLCLIRGIPVIGEALYQIGGRESLSDPA